MLNHLSSCTLVRTSLVIVLTTVGAMAQLPDGGQGAVKVISLESKEFDELWFGTMRTESQWLRMAFYLRRELDGRWSGHIVSLDQRAARIAISSVERTPEKMTISAEGVGAKFEGSFKPESPKLCNGIWSQRGTVLALELSRSEQLPPMEAKQVWRGEINAILAKLRVQLRVLDESGRSVSIVLFDSLTEGISSIVGTMQRSGETITITVPPLKARWRGSMSANGREMKGTWSQGLIPITLNLRREETAVEPEVAPPRRPQTPMAPFPYDVQETTWKNAESSEVELAGTLLRPLAIEPVPAVVLISGSGPQDRDETIAGHKPFWILADHIARHGIAVLRYDDRGVGHSTGEFTKAVTEDLISDARSAIAWLRTQPGIQANRIGIIGHSEGGAIATEIAVADEQIAIVIALGSAALNGKHIVVKQSVEIARREGESPAKLKALEAFITSQCDLVIEDDGTRDLQNARNKHIADYIQAVHVPEDQRGAIADALEKQFSQISPWYRGFLKRDPAVPLKIMKQPILAIWGSKDVQVSAQENSDAMARALDSNPHQPKRELVIVPDLNHLLQPCTTGLPSEYGSIETTMDPHVLARIAIFCESLKDLPN